MTHVIEPGATLGVLGSGQLGRMFAMAARPMGYRICTYSPEKDSPAAQVCDEAIVASYEDTDTLRRFAQQVDAVTVEFENIPSSALTLLQEFIPVHPGPWVLHTAQHRLREKQFLAEHGFPTVPFEAIRSVEDLEATLVRLGSPAVLKTAGFGYDGKGQVKIDQPQQATAAYAALDSQEAILEQFISFACEFSIVAVRSQDGQFTHYGAIENSHKHHILDLSISPGRIPASAELIAIKITQSIMEALNVVGVLCVEFFLTTTGDVLINEMAPRPHNSGHLTIEGHATSQFEQQVRALCGLPLGSTQRLAPVVVMTNLLGEVWQHGEPSWEQALQNPRLKLHLYGKKEARPGRKMGHLTLLGEDLATALREIEQAKAKLLAFPSASTAIEP